MKNNKSWLLGVFLVILFTSFKSQELPKKFTGLMERSKMNFTMPEDMIETPCFENVQMNYEYAVKYKEQEFETRFAIRPLDSLIVRYEREGKHGVHPNNFGDMSFRAVLMNIAIGGPQSGMMPEIYYFDSSDVKKEFKADWGAFAMVMTGKEFGGTAYKYCAAVAIHKDNLGDAYIFFLSDKEEGMLEKMRSSYYALKFK